MKVQSAKFKIQNNPQGSKSQDLNRLGHLNIGILRLFCALSFVIWAYLPSSALAATTGSLPPISDGSQDSASWSTSTGSACSGANCFTEVDEAAGSECSGSDGDTSYIQSATQNAAQTFDLTLADVPDNATITSIEVTTCHVKGQSGQANKFQTRYCLDGTCTNSGSDITPPANYNETSQSFSGLSITKTGTTDLEIGVIITDNANKQTRVSRLFAVLTYTVAGSEESEESESPGNSGSSQGQSDEPHGKGHASQAPLFSADGGADEAPIRLEQGHVEETPAGNASRVVAATPGKPLKLTARPVDFDRVQTVHLRTGGKIYQLKDADHDGVYEIQFLPPPGTAPVPYSLTVDYGITTRTEHGAFVLGTKIRNSNIETRNMMPFVNRLFRTVHDHNPSAEEWTYWAGRLAAGQKQTLPELFGAMQWQRFNAK